eukprot:m.51268 g.51268  ORF g.51268 m.51268 type:complete len:84 (-) comp12971_c0_seq2:1510-1761(-)
MSCCGCSWTTERCVRAMAGTIILTSVALGFKESPFFRDERFLFATAFVGANLFQSAFTGFCPAEKIFRALGVRDNAAGSCKKE